MTPALETLLVCPKCLGALARREDAFVCLGGWCGFRGVIADGIITMVPTTEAEMTARSVFDDQFPVMMHSSDAPGSQAAFYAQQAVALRGLLSGARTVLDIGCGPQLQYDRPPGALLIGIDLSYESLRNNRQVDLRLFGSATSLPLPADSVDAVVCSYALHHMVGQTIDENHRLLRRTLSECIRVLRPGGTLVVFEVTPWWPVWALQRLAWTVLRGRRTEFLGVFFWRRRELEIAARWYMPVGTRFTYRAIRVSPFLVFPFAFTLPRLRLPRLLYPFEIAVYSWRMP